MTLFRCLFSYICVFDCKILADVVAASESDTERTPLMVRSRPGINVSKTTRICKTYYRKLIVFYDGV